MAGIGFELRRILKRETLGAWAHAYVFGGVIVLGPFVCSVVCLAAIAAATRGVVALDVRRLFTGGTVTLFSTSLVATGAVQLVLTRYLADMFYRGAHDRLVGCLFPSLLLGCGCELALVAPLLAAAPLPAAAKLLLGTLALTIGALWLVMVFVTATQGHKAVVTAFLVGSLLAVAAACAGGRAWGLSGLLAGYGAGQFAILVLLIRHVIVEFGYPRTWDFAVCHYLARYPSLVAIGMLFGFGVWADKLVFWHSPLAVSAGGFLTAPKYDSAAFLGFLTSLPAMTHFFVRIEADFSRHFHDYFDAIFLRHSYARIAAAAATLRHGVIVALVDIFLVQGVVSLLLALFAPWLLRWTGLPPSEVGILRYAILGAMFFAFMQFANVVLLYFDRRRAALLTTFVFAVSNPLFSIASLEYGYPLYGFGFAAACLLAMFSSLVLLTNHLFNLEYRTFSVIPIDGRRSGSRLRARRGGLFGRYHRIRTRGAHDQTK